MGLRKTKTIEFMGRHVVVQELDVAQVAEFFRFVREQARLAEEWMGCLAKDPDAPRPAGYEPYEPHTLDILMGSRIPFAQVLRCVPELTEADLCGPGVSASDLEPLYKAVEEVNPFFLRAGNSVMETAEKIGRDPDAALRELRTGARRTTGNPV